MLAVLLLPGCSTTETPKETAGGTVNPPSTNPVADEPDVVSTEPASRYDQLDKIYIGLTATLTGTQSLSGNNALQGAQLAVKQINENGGILGRQVELVYEDEGSDQQTAVNACAKLLSNENITAFWGGNNSSYALAMLDMVTDAEVVFFAGGSSVGIANSKNPWTWQARVTDASIGPMMATVATKTLEMKKPIILASSDSFGTSLAENISNELSTKYGIADVEVLTYNVGETQFGTYIAQIQNSGADGLIATSTQAADAACIMSQCASAGLDIPCLGSNGFSTATAINTAGEAANGWYTMTDWSNQNENEAAQVFESAYVAEYGAASDMQCAYCYDSIMLIAEAIKIAGSADPHAVNAALQSIENFQGAMSVHSYHDNHSFATSLVVVHIEDGLCVPIDTVSF